MSGPPRISHAAAGQAEDGPASTIGNVDENGLHPLVNDYNSKDMRTLLIIFRCINAALVRTFFQPDEYFQSLEPAWQMGFGGHSGAWITWEWDHQLRSSLHPALFAIIYYATDKSLGFVSCFPQFRAVILSILPNLAQGVIAGIGDYYTWQLAAKLYGTGSNDGWTTLLMSVLSPWLWFCSTRTFSNSLETTLTIAALYYWPWGMTVDFETPVFIDRPRSKGSVTADSSISPPVLSTSQSIRNFRTSLLLSCTACILRPTNAIIWFCVLMPTITRLLFSSKSAPPFSDYLVLAREILQCGSLVLLVSSVSDRLYFGEWTFPPYQWLQFNISQDLAVFYGRNDWHYYLSQGLPLLLITYLPFTIGTPFTRQNSARFDSHKSAIRIVLTTIILVTIAILSLISHKEVRFIYPLLPLLHVLTAPTVNAFFTHMSTSRIVPTTREPQVIPGTPALAISPARSIDSHNSSLRRKPLLLLILILNLTISYYTTRIHQSGVISVTKFLRHEYESLALDLRGAPLPSSTGDRHLSDSSKLSHLTQNETFAAFLMPCHSTPWRSQFYYPGLKAWALTCEPPLHIPPRTKERENYRDEADRFYDDPQRFLREEVGKEGREWPRFVVGFEGIEKMLKEHFGERADGKVLKEKWRTFNSHWHDDGRRKGDVVVWEVVG